MPGILPMKVIKVGSSTQQSRIAQACDRCRSKKIRCDGLRPCCTQCSQVGFECKTSDKLSRRAFPRGYTESLEERVRALETETRELKDLLDAKDDKIDMLSRMQSQSASRGSFAHQPNSTPVQTGFPEGQNVGGSGYDAFQSFPTRSDAGGHGNDIYFSGTSSGRGLASALKSKLQDAERSVPQMNIDTLFPCSPSRPLKGQKSSDIPWSKVPPRLFTDQMVNVYFQEWAPLFPIIHRPTFLAMYNEYLANNGELEDKQWVAQINLIFGIGAISSGNRTAGEIQACENQWRASLKPTLLDTNLLNLQCLILAQIFCIQKGDFSKVHLYKALAVGIAQKLGLHQSQETSDAGVLVRESRKKVFWSLYSIDSFSAASTGLPRLFKDTDIGCEYPADVDDEYVTEEGFQPTLPGECTKISSALALFKGSRILSKVLDQLYSNSVKNGLSFSSLALLNEELDSWTNSLPPNLRLAFDREKPSTKVISSRCPFLGLTYHYIRMLIHRPAVCSDVTSQYPFSFMAMASSCKHVVQIVQLLDERKMCFSFCLNKNELLTLCGLGLLFQSLVLGNDSRLMRDTKRILLAVSEMLKKYGARGYLPFNVLFNSILGDERNAASKRQEQTSRSTSNPDIKVSQSEGNTREALKNIAHRYTIAASHPGLAEDEYQQTNAPSSIRSGSKSSDSGKRFRPIAPSTELPSSYAEASTTSSTVRNSTESLSLPPNSHGREAGLNLDYFSFTGSTSTGGPSPAGPMNDTKQQSVPDWERLLSTLDPNDWHAMPTANFQDNGAAVDAGHQQAAGISEISPEMWDIAGDLFEHQTPDTAALIGEIQPSQKTGSTTSGSLASGPEDFVKVDFSTGSKSGSSCDSGGSGVELPDSKLESNEDEVFKAIVMPETLDPENETVGPEVPPAPADENEF